MANEVSGKRKLARIDDEEKENQGTFDIIKKKLRPSMDLKEKSDPGSVDAAEGTSVLSMAHDSGFVSGDDMTPKRVNSETRTCVTSYFHETSKSPFRQNTGDQEDLILKIKLYDKVYDYGTKGNETIHEMVLRMLREIEHRRDPNVNRMLFKTLLGDCHLNLGLPTGALKRDVIYECVFMGRSNKNTTDFLRKYSVTQFHDDWDINSFDVKLESKIIVGYVQTIQIVSKVQVPFFPEETLYEALCRDGRFEKTNSKGESVIRTCDFISVDGKDNVVLSAKAIEYKRQCFMFKKRSKENKELQEKVPPLGMPSHVASKVLSTFKDEPITPIKYSGEASPTVFQPSVYSTPATSYQARKLQSFNDLQLYIEEDLGLKLNPERSVKKEEQRKRKFEKFLKEHCQNFALDFPHSFSMSDLEHFVNLKFSIGAVIGVNVNNVKKCFGTCFRIGKMFVLTNYHVFELVTKFAGESLRDSYVDFNYKQTEEGHAVRFIDTPLLFYSKELDYAIMELDSMFELPASVTDQGYSIAPPYRHLETGENLSLIGHPNGMEKMVNMSCPIKPQKQIEDHLNLAVHALEKMEYEFYHKLISEACSNPFTIIYDVSDFFWGSSGSPGILINEKLIIVLHFHGIILGGKHVMEQGILMSSIVEDVIKKLDGNYVNSYLTLDDIFGEGTKLNFQQQTMEIDLNNSHSL